MSTSTTKLERTEQQTVFEWRVDELRRVGIRENEARMLAASDSDLHKMIDAKLAGCDVACLVRIFT